MKLFIKEKLWTFHNKYFVSDENGNNVIEISSKPISFRDKTWVKDMNGNELLYVEQELLSIPRKDKVYIKGKHVYSIQNTLDFISNCYKLTNNYKVTGDMINRNFTICNDKNEVIGTITRILFAKGDQYEMDIIDN